MTNRSPGIAPGLGRASSSAPVTGGGAIRWTLWAAGTLLLVGAAYGAGRLHGGVRTLPSMVATLQGDESGFSRGFDDALRARFPVGSSEEDLIAFLKSEKFAPDWRRRDEANASVLTLDGLICRKILRVTWRADASGALTAVNGSYASQCL